MVRSTKQLLSVWTAIGEEYEFLAGERLGPDFDHRVQTYNQVCGKIQGDDKAAHHPDADAAREAERDLAAFVCEKMRRRGFNALCFSGGGIRSATLSLGILEALAQHSKADPQTGDSASL